jgi:hypothetical protein
MTSSSVDSTAGSSESASSTRRNAWDFGTVLAVLVFLGIMTWFLVRHYTSVTSAGTILGIITPVLGAIFGVTIGYSAGNTTGQAQGRDAAKAKIKSDLQPKLENLAAATTRQVPVEHHGAITPSINEARGYLQAL